MPVAFHCSACQHSIKLRDELLGKKIKCPKCQAVGVVGEGAAANASSSKASKPATSGASATRKKPVPAETAGDDSDKFLANLQNANFDKYQDVEPTEEELEEEELAREEQEQAKAAQKLKKKRTDVPGGTKSEDKGVLLAMIGLCGIASALMGATTWYLILPLIGATSVPVTPPEKFKTWDHLYGEFKVDVPDEEGWEVKDSGSNRDVSPWLKIKKGTVIIEIRQDEAGTVIGAVGGGSLGQDVAATLGVKGVDGPNAADPAMSRMIFDRYSNKTQENFKVWDAGSPKPINTHMGDGRIAKVEFQETALSKKRVGTLAAMFPSKAYTVLCYCDEDKYETMKPFFEKVIVSMLPIVNGQPVDMMP